MTQLDFKLQKILLSRENLAKFTLGFAVIGIASVVYMFFQTLAPTEVATANRPYFEVEIADIPAGSAHIFEWHGKPFYVLHRTETQINSLHLVVMDLRDPNSLQVPKLDHKLDEPWRSVTKDFLVVSLLSNTTQCGAHYRKEPPLDWDKPWYGGFFDSCRVAVYDVAGRVYASSRSEAKNLIAIPHAFYGSKLRVYVDAI